MCRPSPLPVIAWHNPKEVRNTRWSVIPVDDFWCFTLFFFKRPLLSSRLFFISLQWEKSSLSQLVCLLKHKHTRAACSSNNPVVRLTYAATNPRISNRKQHISCSWVQKWGAKSTKRAFDLQGWCSQKQHGRCSHNRQHQHVPCNCAHAATRHANKIMLWAPLLSRDTNVNR